MNYITSLFFIFSINLLKTNGSPQITKLVPLDDWVAFKERTSQVNPLDKFFGKLRATYDFIFHRPDNVSNVEKIIADDKSWATENSNNKNHDRLITPMLPLFNHIVFKNNNSNKKSEIDMNKNLYIRLYPEENLMSTYESSISRISKDDEWPDDVETVEPLSQVEIDNENIDRSVEAVTPSQSSFQFPIAVVRAFAKWLESILSYTHQAYSAFARKNN
ncbi:GSCOCG00002351001-RA-CDS [Cotesia congregata]|uniref:Uncharacterized protein n=1 Tax=Cotesia congregata TaxID=51543 RepID=A0A8J2HMV0_COTCN|nr:GSCOCG00002351001-RA-CDS [Cotesia congregata]CAG5103667.1 Protein of unknown function [Cotesia congregata]